MFSHQEVLGLRTFLYAICALCLPEMCLLVEEATPAAEGIHCFVSAYVTICPTGCLVLIATC